MKLTYLRLMRPWLRPVRSTVTLQISDPTRGVILKLYSHQLITFCLSLPQRHAHSALPQWEVTALPST